MERKKLQDLGNFLIRTYACPFCVSMKKSLWLKLKSYTFGFFLQLSAIPKHWNSSYREAFRDPLQ